MPFPFAALPGVSARFNLKREEKREKSESQGEHRSGSRRSQSNWIAVSIQPAQPLRQDLNRVERGGGLDLAVFASMITAAGRPDVLMRPECETDLVFLDEEHKDLFRDQAPHCGRLMMPSCLALLAAWAERARRYPSSITLKRSAV